MNIFVLHESPVVAAQMQCDKHVVKMCLETAQLLCSLFPPGFAPYKRTHYNHPCGKWTRESYANYQWLITHGLALCDEYNYRYGKKHKCRDIILWCKQNVTPSMFDQHSLTALPKCMPEEYKVSSVVESYRNYYKGAKKDFAAWTKRDIPVWF